MDVFISVQNRASGTPHTKVRCKRQKTNRFNEEKAERKSGRERMGRGEFNANGEIKTAEE